MNTRRSIKKMLAMMLCIVMFVTMLPTFAFAKDLDAPKLNSAKAVADGIKVSWKSVSGADSYRVYRKSGSSNWAKLKDTSGTSYTDTSVKDGTAYTYTVRCLNSSGKECSPYNGTVSATWTSKVLDAPIVKSATANSSGVKVVWGEVETATKYRLYRKVGSGSWTKVADVSGTSYTDKDVKAGKTYTYTVRCLNSSGKECSGYNSTQSVTYTKYATPKLVSATAGSNGIVVKWNAVSGAPKYQVYRKIGSGNWSKLAQTTGTSYTDKTAVTNTDYTYTVRVISEDGKNELSDYEKPGVSCNFAGRAAVSSLSNERGYVLVKWSAVAGTDEYRVYRKSGSGSWTMLADVPSSDTQYKDTSAVSNITYTYTVRGRLSGEFVGTWDSTGKSITYYAPPTLVEASDEGTGVKVTWETVEGISIYRIYRKINDGGWKELGDASGTSYLDTTVESGVKATYTVRCVKGSSVVSQYESPGVTAVTTGYSNTFHAAPLLTGVRGVNGGIKFTWQEVDGVTKYQVYRKDTTKTSWEKVALVTSMIDKEWVYIDTAVKEGGKYSYTVACSDGTADTSEKNETGLSATYFKAPTMVSATNKVNGVEIAWQPVDGVGTYRIYRKTGSGSWSVIASSVARSNGDKNSSGYFTYVDTTAKSTGHYSYAVACLVGGVEMSGYDETGVDTTFYSAPKLTSATAQKTKNGVLVKWQGVDGIGKYQVYRRTGSGSWTKIGTSTTTSYEDTSVTSNTKYTYTVRCMIGSNIVSYFYSAGVAIDKYYDVPTLISITASGSGVQLKWQSVTGALRYQVYRKTETGGWTKVGTTTGVSLTDKKATSGVFYYYTVRVVTDDSAHTELSGYQSPGLSVTAK